MLQPRCSSSSAAMALAATRFGASAVDLEVCLKVAGTCSSAGRKLAPFDARLWTSYVMPVLHAENRDPS